MGAKKRSLFLVLEGIDKSGKSTQAGLLTRNLRRRGIPCLLTREPGGTPLGEHIRRILLETKENVAPKAELLLYEASRAQHVQAKILPRLNKGGVVISDRFALASEAYQGTGRGLGALQVRRLNKYATGGLRPDLTILIDLPVQESLKRMNGKRDRMEQKNSFLMEARQAYLRLASRDKSIIVVNGAAPKDAIHREILARLNSQSLWRRLVGSL